MPTTEFTTAGHVALIGTGVIGASWATCFLAYGLDVVATDPSPGAEQRLREQVQRHWPAATALGLAPDASLDRLSFCATAQQAVQGACFVQENGPERVPFKREMFALLDEVAPPEVILASSSSGILPAQFQSVCKHPQRVLIGHPFNPPHLIPLVEVVGSDQTSAASIAVAMRFYAAVGRKPIHIRKAMKGFVTNRLQAALWREAYGLVQAGVVSVQDIDTAIANGPGLRWALLGPFATQHLSGGEGGLAHVLQHLGPPMDEYWQDLLPTRLTDEVRDAVLSSASQQTDAWDIEAVTRERDALLVQLLKLKSAAGHLD